MFWKGAELPRLLLYSWRHDCIRADSARIYMPGISALAPGNQPLDVPEEFRRGPDRCRTTGACLRPELRAGKESGRNQLRLPCIASPLEAWFQAIAGCIREHSCRDRVLCSGRSE